MQAYLVISQGSRWTDIFRLQPGITVVIGRSSDNQIVIRDDRASRRHAEIALREGGWVVRDLGSRNGTQVNERVLVDEHTLADGDTIVVAGCHMSFVRDLSQAFLPVMSGQSSGQVSSAQTAEHGLDAPTIVQRRNHSRWTAGQKKGDEDNSIFLYRLVFDLVSTNGPIAAAQIALESLLSRIGVQAGGVILLRHQGSQIAKDAGEGLQTVLAAKQAAGQAYHRVSDFLVNSILKDGQSVLARNVQMDSQLSLARESGQRQTSSIICAPLKENKQVVGVLHVYTSLSERMLTDDDLELAIAVADNLSVALTHQQAREQLSLSLETSRRKVDQLERQLGQHSEMVGNSPAMERVRREIEKSAPTQATVLIRGESGVGKELVARAIHIRSNRREGPLVCLNCAALAPTLLESELFGHEKGSFTGATDRKIGKFEAAHGGTLLLDEIGEMSLELQAKFLRVIEGQPFERLGGNKPIQTNVRIIAATNRDLEQAVREKQFRSDLYFRLRVIEIDVPPLRERLSDIPLLAEHFLESFRQHAGRRLDGFSPKSMELMSRYAWPGNIRELRNVVERAVVLGVGATIEPDDLSISPLAPIALESTATSQDSNRVAPGAYRAIRLEELEKEHILATLENLNGNKSRAAIVLGVERSTLDRKLKRYELQQDTN